MNRRMSSREFALTSLKPEKEIPFSIREYESRCRAVRSEMEREDIDLLFLSSPESMFYLSGYQAEWYQASCPPIWAPVSGIAIHRDRADFVLFDTEEELLMTRYTTVSKDTRIIPDEGDMIDWITRQLEADELLPGTVGLEMSSYRPYRTVSERFQAALERAGCRVVDGTDLVRRVRRIKSQNELGYIRRAAEIGDIGMRAAAESIKAGVSELEVYGEIVRSMASAGGENPAITLPVISGLKSACVHALASRKKIEKGEIVNVDICGVFNRYHSNLARTFSVGEPDPEIERIVRLSAGSFGLLRDILRPNIPVAEVNERIMQYYEDRGILDDRLWSGGYELGIAFPPDWVGSFVYDPSIDPSGQKFAPGNVVNYESNFYLPKKAGASLLINTLVFDRAGAEILGKTQNEIIIVGQ